MLSPPNEANRRVTVAMSGGVDSSVVAALLVRQGYEVQGVTLQLNPCEDRQVGRSCCGVDAVLSARRVADQLGIPHCVIDCRREFEREVLRPAWDEYRRGRTPSPCIVCNQAIKFGFLLERAARLGAPRIASGHYARIVPGPDGRPQLWRGRDPSKDQSYFLFALSEDQLAALLFPLGDLPKSEVRALASELGLASAERPDSQDACLGTSEDGFAESLRLRFDADAAPGPIEDRGGKVLGQHEGLHRFTVGQRQRLGVSLGRRAYVYALEPERNAVVLTTAEDDLWAGGLALRLVQEAPGGLPERCRVQIRSRHQAVEARVEAREGAVVRLRFELRQRAVTPGQAAVLYDGERVAGGGWIERPME